MSSTHDAAAAGTIAAQVNSMMAAQQIPATPPNYAVWYAYYAGEDLDLKRAVDEESRNGSPFTGEFSEVLYERFFSLAGEIRLLRETGDGLQHEIAGLVGDLHEASADSGAFGKKLQGYAKVLANDDSGNGLGGVVREILIATRELARKSHQLENKLQISSREIEQLQDRLEAAQQESVTDGLTGITNRKGFDRRLNDEAHRALRESRDLSLLIADIDHFKTFNDTHGHSVGDSVLKLVARCLRDTVRPQDLPARYGGEEFCILLPDTELSGAKQLAQGIRAGLTSKELKNKRTGDSYGRVTMSIGVAQLRPGEQQDQLLQRADEALYMAKQSGRDCVACEADLAAGSPLSP